MRRESIWLALLFTALFAFPASAEDSPSFVRQIVIMWLPLAVFIGLWLFLLRRMGVGLNRRVLERSLIHMDALEKKVDRLIEILEARERS